MYINIITPCSRPENLKIISESINIPRENYRWIIVFDSETVPENTPENAECYAVKNHVSISGNAQRNLALDLVKEGYIYFNDDDTIIQSNLWDKIKDLTEEFISFPQLNKDGTVRLDGKLIAVNHIDSHNFITSFNCVRDSRWVLHNYGADGLFAVDCFTKAKTYKYIDTPLSVYNSLQ